MDPGRVLNPGEFDIQKAAQALQNATEITYVLSPAVPYLHYPMTTCLQFLTVTLHALNRFLVEYKMSIWIFT